MGNNERNGDRARAWLLVLMVALASGGCGEKTPETFAKFVPASGEARRVLVAALDDWKNGRAPGDVSIARPKARIVDTFRRPDQRLARFAIIGEVPHDHARAFAVRLTFENPEEETVVRYVVFGIDPLWIYRQEDYEMLAHWEHKMEEPEAKAAEDAPGP